MTKRFTGLVLSLIAVVFSAKPTAAQATVWRIDSTQSTARLYVTSSNRRDARINVGVARLGGNAIQNSGAFLPGTIAFQIYPADRNGKPGKPQAPAPVSPARVRPKSTTIEFRSKSVQMLDEKSFLVQGELTATYISQTAEYDPSKGYAGPVFGPPVAHSMKRDVGFVFRTTTPRGAKRGNAEWSASSIIPSDLFPELWNAVLTTDWPSFVLGEKCSVPPGTGEDFSGPACTGKLIEPAPRTDTVCTMPSSVGEDFSGVTCTGTPLTALPRLEVRNSAAGRQSAQNSSTSLANELEIELVIRLERTNPAPQKPPAGPADPTAHRDIHKLAGIAPA